MSTVYPAVGASSGCVGPVCGNAQPTSCATPWGVRGARPADGEVAARVAGHANATRIAVRAAAPTSLSVGARSKTCARSARVPHIGREAARQGVS